MIVMSDSPVEMVTHHGNRDGRDRPVVRFEHAHWRCNVDDYGTRGRGNVVREGDTAETMQVLTDTSRAEAWLCVERLLQVVNAAVNAAELPHKWRCTLRGKRCRDTRAVLCTNGAKLCSYVMQGSAIASVQFACSFCKEFTS